MYAIFDKRWKRIRRSGCVVPVCNIALRGVEHGGLASLAIGCDSLFSTDCSPAYLSTQNARTHTICYAAASPHWLFTFLTNFRISNFNKDHRAPWRWSEWWTKHVGAFSSVFNI